MRSPVTRSALLLFSCAVSVSTGLQAAETVWNFSDVADRFAPDSGGSTLEFYDPFESGWGVAATGFGSASSFGLPLIAGSDPQVMAFPACTFEEGYLVTHGFAPNGFYGETFELVSTYTVIMDVLYPSESDGAFRALVQTDPFNGTDAELFVDDALSGGIGINGNYRGAITPDTWHRIIWVVRAADGEGQAHRYIDGQFVGAIGTTGSALEDRFGLEPEFLLFTDENGETQPGFVSSISVIDRALTYEEATALGGPSGDGTGVPGPAAVPYAERMSRPVLPLGHRGSSGGAPENTLAAIGQAFLDGAAGTEIDTRITSDGVVVAFHDATLDRTTNGTGEVANSTLEELKELDAGSWFSPAFSGEKVPTLEEVLTASKGKGIIYLDIKTEGQTDGFATAVDASGFPLEDLWFWTPGNPAYAAEIRAAIPGAKIVWGAPDAAWRTDPTYFDDLRALGVVGFSYGFGGADLQFSARAKEEGMFVEVYTLLSPRDIITAAAAGVDYIETDFPAVMQALQPALLEAASSPSPADGAPDIAGSPVLAWTPAAGSTAHRVHFGIENPPPFVAEQSSDLFQTADLVPGTPYYWRIDGVTPDGTAPGTVWSFTTPAPTSEGTAHEWHFEGNLNSSAGDAVLTFAFEDETEDLVEFATTDGTLVPHLTDGPTRYLSIPAFFDPGLGLDLTFTSTEPNGGGESINQYSFVFDVFVPGPLNWMPFFNTDPFNSNDSDFFVRADSAVGIGELGYSGEGSFTPDAWHRVIFSADLTNGIVTYFIDGAVVAQRTGDPLTDGRFSLYSSNDTGPHVKLFNDNDGETLDVFVSAVAFIDEPLDEAAAAALGLPLSTGIFVAGPTAPAASVITSVSYDETEGSVTLSWTASPGATYAVDVSTDLVLWSTLESDIGPDGPSATYTEGDIDSSNSPVRYYRVRTL